MKEKSGTGAGKGIGGLQQGRSGEFGQVTSSDQTVKNSTSIDSKFYKPRKSEYTADLNDGKGMSK